MDIKCFLLSFSLYFNLSISIFITLFLSLSFYFSIISGKLGTVVQITVCQSKVDPDRIVIFANTHLFFHPAAAFARLLQTDVIVSTCMHVRNSIQTAGLGSLKDLKINGEEVIDDEGDRVVNENEGKVESDQSSSIIAALRKLELGNDVHDLSPPRPLRANTSPVRVSIMLLGDLNSTPETAVIEYFKTYVHTYTLMHAHVHTKHHTMTKSLNKYFFNYHFHDSIRFVFAIVVVF